MNINKETKIQFEYLREKAFNSDYGVMMTGHMRPTHFDLLKMAHNEELKFLFDYIDEIEKGKSND